MPKSRSKNKSTWTSIDTGDTGDILLPELDGKKHENWAKKQDSDWILVYSVWPADEKTKVPKRQDTINVKHLGECNEKEAIERAEQFKYDWEHQLWNLGTGAYEGKPLRTLDYCELAEVKKQLGVNIWIKLGVYVGN